MLYVIADTTVFFSKAHGLKTSDPAQYRLISIYNKRLAGQVTKRSTYEIESFQTLGILFHRLCYAGLS